MGDMTRKCVTPGASSHCKAPDASSCGSPGASLGEIKQVVLMSSECLAGQQEAIVGRLRGVGVASTPETAVAVARETQARGTLGSSALQNALVPGECVAGMQAYLVSLPGSLGPGVLTPANLAAIAAVASLPKGKMVGPCNVPECRKEESSRGHWYRSNIGPICLLP